MGACIGALVGGMAGGFGHWQATFGIDSPFGFRVEGTVVVALIGIIIGAILVRTFFHEQIEWSTGVKCGAILGGLSFSTITGIAIALTPTPQVYDDTRLFAILVYGFLGMLFGIIIGALISLIPSLLGWVAMKFIYRIK